MSKFLWIIIIFGTAVSACKTGIQKNAANSNSFSIIRVSANEYTSLKQQSGITYDTLLYQKENGVLKLPISEKWHSFIVLADTLAGSENNKTREYKYIGELQKKGLFIVNGNFYEHSEDYLIDKITGEKTAIWNQPKISPAGRYIVDIRSYGLEGEPNGLQIWQINERDFEGEKSVPPAISKILEIDQSMWVPIDFAWEGEHSLLIKAVSLEKFIQTNDLNKLSKDYYYLKVTIP